MGSLTGQQTARPERNGEQDLKADGGSHNLLDVAADDRQLGHNPQQQGSPLVVLQSADVGEVGLGYDPQSRRETLENQASYVREE